MSARWWDAASLAFAAAAVVVVALGVGNETGLGALPWFIAGLVSLAAGGVCAAIGDVVTRSKS